MILGKYGVIDRTWQTVFYILIGILIYVLGLKNQKKYSNKDINKKKYWVWIIIVLLIFLILLPFLIL